MLNTLSIRPPRRPRRAKHTSAPAPCADADLAASRDKIYNRYLKRLRSRIHGSRWFLAQMRRADANVQ